MNFRKNLKVFEYYNVNPDLMQKYLRNALIFLAGVSVILNTINSLAFGIKSLLIILTAILVAIETEKLFYWHTKKQTREKSAILIKQTYPLNTGLLIALLMPISAPLISVALSTAFAMYLVRNAFGGFSYNIFNVAVAARVFYEVSWSALIQANLLSTSFFDKILILIFPDYVNNVSFDFATYFNNLYSLQPIDDNLISGLPSLLYNDFSLILLGAVSPIALIGAAVYLIYKKVIKLDVIVTYIIGTMIMFFGTMFFSDYLSFNQMINYIFLSPMLLVLLFYATDNVTTGWTLKANIIYGLMLSVSTFLMGYYSSSLGPILFAILFSNMLMPIINKQSNNTKGFVTFLTIIGVIAAITIYLLNGQVVETASLINEVISYV